MTELVKKAMRRACLDMLDELVSRIGALKSTELAAMIASAQKDDASRREFIQKWNEAMSWEMDRRVKYASVVQRILGKPGNCYTVCQYRDADSLRDSVSAHLTQDLSVYHEAYGALASDAKKDAWEVIEEVNRVVQRLLDVTPVVAPTREQIRVNILEHKRTSTSARESKTCVASAFQATTLDIFAALGCDVPQSVADMSTADWTTCSAAWCAQLDAPCAGSTLQAMIDSHSWDAATGYEWQTLDELRMAISRATDQQRTAAHPLISQMSSFCKVQAGIPTNMMTQIEKYAQKLAVDMSNGKMSMSDLDLGQIGQAVLEQCDPKDMDSLTSNLGGLMPSLQKLQQNMVIPPSC